MQDGTIIIGPDASRTSAVTETPRETVEVEYLTGEWIRSVGWLVRLLRQPRACCRGAFCVALAGQQLAPLPTTAAVGRGVRAFWVRQPRVASSASSLPRLTIILRNVWHRSFLS